MILKSVRQFVMPQVRDLLDRHVSGTFIGRSEELCSLHDILSDEGPVVVHLHGIAGIGKSRLLSAFVQVARAKALLSFDWTVAVLNRLKPVCSTSLQPRVEV
jgi:hypothetical protein